ncbi:MAG TPA: hypothetical protein PLH84_09750 [Candidatus Krumholzibacteria bacterium]|nr:hypothetical protein [Candidatus Krumholzibacteria bacterium]
MNWEAISAIGGMLGAIGVIVSLVYLAIQLRQNTKAYQIGALQDAMENSARFSELIASDDELARTFWLGLTSPDELNAAEMRRFVTTLNVFMRRESVAYYLYKQGSMPEELWKARERAFTGVLNQPGLEVYLEKASETLPDDFRGFIVEAMGSGSTLNEATRDLLTRQDA